MIPFKTFDLTKYLDIVIIDSEYEFTDRITYELGVAGFKNLYYGSSIKLAEEMLLRRHIDVLLLEFDPKYGSVWKLARTMPNFETFIIGTTTECSVRIRLAAIEAGAERVIAKSWASTVLAPMLLRLSQGSCSRRFRVVPFPGSTIDR